MKALSVVLSLAISALFAGAVLADGDHDTATLKQISLYRAWTRVNADPVAVSVPVGGTAGAISIDPATLT